MIYENILQTIGNTPIIKINRLFKDVQVYLKLERTNPGGSIKDRIALAMIEDAERSGTLTPSMTIVEPTSGNTGVGLSMVAAVKGYKIILVMPESMSIERRRVMSSFGAQLVLTPKEKGMKGAIEKSDELLKENAHYWSPRQFENPSNFQVHKETTAQEIIKDFPRGFDALITGVGTGGHITGCGEVIKEKFPKTKIYAVEPEKSPVISGGSPGPHRIQGIGAGFIPQNLHTQILDGIIQVSEEEAFHFAREAALKEGIFIGISSGATLAAISKKSKEIAPGGTILGFCYDTGERYLSVQDLFV